MRKVLLFSAAIIVSVATVPMFAAFEAHVINVTATIENALTVTTSEITFGTVFPQEKLNQTFGVTLSAAFQASGGLGSNLLVNGSFEQPIITDPQNWDIFPDGTPGLGWTVEWETGISTYQNQPRPNPALQELHAGVLGLADDGDQYTELDSDWDGPNGPLNGEPALVKIYQDVSTIAGKEYRLTYAYSPRPNIGAGDNTLVVRVEGAQVNSHSAAGGPSISWTDYQYDFVAADSSTRIEFAGGGTNNSLGVFLDSVSLMSKGRVNEVQYVLRQKPKCVDQAGAHPQVTEDINGDFICPPGSTMMPLLCPYLSKHEQSADGLVLENDSSGITAFHGLPGPWDLDTTILTQVTGVLSTSDEDIEDEWLIDLKVPCFTGSCAQDWAAFVQTESGNPNINPSDYEVAPNLSGQTFGCDLWLEVTAIQ